MANVTLNVTDNNGKEAGTLEAPEALFGFTAEEVQAHVPLIHQGCGGPACSRPPGHACGQEPRRRLRWWPQAVEAEGHRSRSSGLNPRSSVVPRRRRARPRSRVTTAQRTPKKMKGRSPALRPLRSRQRRSRRRRRLPARTAAVPTKKPQSPLSPRSPPTTSPPSCCHSRQRQRVAVGS